MYHKNLNATAKTLQTEIKRLQTELKSIDSQRTRITQYLMYEMMQLGKISVQHGTHKAQIRKSPIAIEILNATQVPDDFKEREVKISIKKQDIKNHFKETGEIVPGTDVIQREHLRIS